MKPQINTIRHSLVESAVYKVVSPYRAWKSKTTSDSFDLFPACLPIEGDRAQPMFSTEPIKANAEMYGGPGLGGNAGGVRCANYAGYQCKGVGRTILAGNSTDKWHKHGALSLQDAVKEAIFSALFNWASPYGAIETYAVYDLGIPFATEIGEEKKPGSAPRALLLRECSVRIAHFMRSPFLDAGQDLAAREVYRMRYGIPELVNYLASGTDSIDIEVVTRSLALVYGCLMHQAAVLRSKRLVHGSLIPSNFTLDGRFLDFTTATAVSTLQPTLVSRGGFSSQRQHLQILDSLEDLIFYIGKFDKRCVSQKSRVVALTADSKAFLMREHNDHLMHEHLLLLGFSAVEVSRMSFSVRCRLLDALLKLIGEGSIDERLYFGGDEHPMLPQSGRDDIFAAISYAISVVGRLILPSTSNYAPDPHVFSATSLQELCSAYRDAVTEISQAYSDFRMEAVARIVRAMHRSADLEPLYRRNIDGDINDVVVADGDFVGFINAAISRWKNVFRTDLSGDIFLEGWLTSEDAVLSADSVLIVQERPNAVDHLLKLTPARDVRPRHRWLFDLLQVNAKEFRG